MIHAQRKALKAKLTGVVKTECESWLKRDERRQEIEKEKKAAQAALRTYVNGTINTKQKAIKDLLEPFGTNLRISGTKASFVGQEAKAVQRWLVDGVSPLCHSWL